MRPIVSNALLSAFWLLCNCSTKAVYPDSKNTYAGTEQFYFERFQDNRSTEYFSISQPLSGYNLKAKTGKLIATNVHYVKTFGGSFGAISVHVLGGRFLAYPETIKGSDVPDTIFHDQHAVTHIYDLKHDVLLSTSKPYRYDHDVPLRYNFDEITKLAAARGPSTSKL